MASMQPCELVLEQIHHHETRPIPFTLYFEPAVAARVDAHYGSDAWRTRIPQYMLYVSTVDAERRERIDATRHRDAFGSVWNTGGRPVHLESPGLKASDFDGYAFPSAATFIDAEAGRQAARSCRGNPHLFRAAQIGWGLFERSWTIRGFAEALVDAAEVTLRELVGRMPRHRFSKPARAARTQFFGSWGDGWRAPRSAVAQGVKPRLAMLYQACHEAGS
jgi:hypothetical protein